MSEDPGAAPVEGTPTESTPSAPEWAPVLDRVGELAGTVEEMQSGFQQFLQSQQQPEPEQEQDDPWAALMGDPEPEEPEPQMLDLAALQQAVQQQIAQSNQPLLQQIQDMQRAQGREQLLKDIPQLQDPEVAQQTIAGMQQYLQASGAPQEVQQWMVNSPQAIAQFFKAAEAEKLAAGQAPASEQVPSLEPAGGAVPGGDGGPPDPVKSAYENAWSLPKGLR